MANNAYIIEREAEIMAFEKAIQSLIHHFKEECLRNLPRDGSCSCGSVDRENKDCWSTLLLNARSLKRKLDAMICVMEPHLPGA